MKWKKGLLAAALGALLLGLLVPAFGSASSVNLMAVNERVLDVTNENMPRTVGGVLYVPYTMLSNRSTGINLGVNAMYSTTRRTVLVSDGVQRGVIFDTQANNAEDLQGNALPVRAMVRNSMVFLPIDWLCSYFGTIQCSRSRTPYGTLIRVTNSAAILSDLDFVDAADAGGQLADSLRNYSAGGEGSTVPSSAPSPGPSVPPSGAELFLALRSGEAARDCAGLLESRGQRALFLFSGEELDREGGLVRRIAAAGHTVGLALAGDSPESCLAEAERGRAVLAGAARYNALVVSAPNLDSAGQEALREAGYVVWNAAVRGEDWASGSAMVRRLDTRKVNYVELECGAGGLSFLRAALAAMEEENCQLHLATAPALS